MQSSGHSTQSTKSVRIHQISQDNIHDILQIAGRKHKLGQTTKCAENHTDIQERYISAFRSDL